MTTTEVIQILITHNAWRRGADVEPEDLPSPKQIGDAIHEAVRLLKSKEIDDLIDSCDAGCCPKCGSMDVIWTCYCNECKEAM